MSATIPSGIRKEIIVLPLLTHLDHVGIACRDLRRAIDMYGETFGLKVVHLEENEEQGVREAMLAVGPAGALLSPGGTAPQSPSTGGSTSPYPPGPPGAGTGDPGVSYIQLLEPLSPDTPVGKFIARRGEGIHHVGYRVADIREALATVAGTGVRLVDERPRHGSMGASIAFLHPADLGGVLTELVQPLAPA
jgi:methylmalonyl-CoA/ethylmalonyl-CoA epimerase